jgi:hypothetical protein
MVVAKNRSMKLQESSDHEFQRYQKNIVKLSEFEASSLDAVLKAVRMENHQRALRLCCHGLNSM